MLNKILIAAAITGITLLHFLTPTEYVLWHEIYQRVYYIPIIAAALLYGLRGGLAASLYTSVTYLPHILLHWQHGHFDYAINQYAEIVIFNVVGGLMGALGDRLRQARERAERSAAETREAYEELRRTFEQLLQAEKLSSLGELSAGIVHEVRNPLGSIRGAVEILEDEIAPDSPRREFSELAKKEVDRIDRIVGEFLRFARPATLSVGPVDLNSLVGSVASLVENQAAMQGVGVEKTLATGMRPVSADAEQIKQVLLNLAINALQAMPDGGTLGLRTYASGGSSFVEVADTGSGIDEKHLAKIFDPFFTTKEKGIGLGLSVAHKIVKEHGGNLTAESRDGRTVFRLELPAGR